MVHYVYKITFLSGSLCGHYYIGKRSYNGSNIDRDTYCGSGKICDDYFKTHKKILNETYKKDILKICDTEKDAYEEEERILGDLFETDEKCVNVKRGGYGGFSTKTPWNKGKVGLQVAWNKGLTKKDARVKKYSDAKIGKSHAPWNKGLKGSQVAWNKGLFGRTHVGKKIIQTTIDGKFIAEFTCIRDAAEKYGINERFISKCCKGKIDSYKGYKWKFKDEK